MCGISGSFSRELTRATKDRRRESLARLRHRGPDSEGWFEDQHAVLGFRRLSIIDVEGGDQPFLSTDESAVLTLNGELYNHRALKAQLRGAHDFRSCSDAEVLVHRYTETGLRGLLAGVNGMFAFALYDRRRRRVILARDRAGQKPLYWRRKDGVLSWSSELKGLLGDERPELNTQAINDYLRFGYIPAPLTIFEGVSKLPAGCVLTCGLDMRPRIERYWKLVYAEGADRPLRRGELDWWRTRIRDGLTRAVEQRLESEVPMGFLLSGGVDSASVFALGARATAKRVKAFTIGFPDEQIDESLVASEVASMWGAEHFIRKLGQDEAGDLGHVLFLTEEPISTDALLPTARVFSQVSEAGFTTVLTGEGSDEIMAGYAKFAEACDWVEGTTMRETRGSALERYLAHEEFCFPEPRLREALLGQSVDDGRFGELERESEHLDPLGQMLHFEARLRLPDRINPRLDRLSMAWSIEARAPFMDYQFQELCATMPHRLRRGAAIDKMILREAMRPLLPEAVFTNAKAPFKAPARWFVHPSQLAAELSDEAVEKAGMIAVDEVRRMRSDSKTNRRREEELYSLYVLHAWHRCFIRQTPASVEEITARTP